MVFAIFFSGIIAMSVQISILQEISSTIISFYFKIKNVLITIKLTRR